MAWAGSMCANGHEAPTHRCVLLASIRSFKDYPGGTPQAQLASKGSSRLSQRPSASHPDRVLHSRWGACTLQCSDKYTNAVPLSSSLPACLAQLSHESSMACFQPVRSRAMLH